MASTEKRKNPRVVAHWHVDAVDVDGRHHTGISENISHCGIQVAFQDNFVANQRLKLKIQAIHKGNALSIETVAVVIYTVLKSSTGNFNAGLRFLKESLNEETKSFISNYLKAHL